MNWKISAITLAKVLFMIFLIIELTLTGITVINNAQSFTGIFGHRIWFSISFYIFIFSTLRMCISQTLMGIAFLGMVQVLAKRFVRKNDEQPSMARIR